MSGTLELYKALFEPFSDALKKTKKQGGQTITFVEWHAYIDRAHKTFPEGFSTEVRSVQTIGSVWSDDGDPVDDRQVVVVLRVTDNATGVYQEATGAAPVAKKKEKWGGAMPEAESQALRRAFAKWGLGLEMYLDDDSFNSYADWQDAESEEGESEDDDADEDGTIPMTKDQVDRLKQLAAVLVDNEMEDVLEAAREKIADAHDQKKVAGIIIRKIKEHLEENEIEWDEDADPS